jgi:hypothetical protein
MWDFMKAGAGAVARVSMAGVVFITESAEIARSKNGNRKRTLL